MIRKIVQRAVLRQGMRVKLQLVGELKEKIFTVIRVDERVAKVLGSQFPVTQRILIVRDRKGDHHEFDLTRSLNIKNKKGKWVKRYGT